MTSLTNFLSHSAFALVGLGIAAVPAHAINITTTNDPNALVNQILGGGITVSNVTYNGAPAASGIFTNGLSSGIGIDSGIILTTGDASLAVGPNSLPNSGVNNGLPGDTDLNSLIPGSTFDATVLEFDFISETGNLFFNYVFASEEYNEFVNSNFNDVFAFFLNGENIALIPGTTTPVSINNVNGGNPLGVDASNPAFYINNNTGAFNIEYDGFTTVFTAQATGLVAGSTNRIKLAIADVGDSVLDSAVFIQASTFSGMPPQPVPEPTTMLGLLAFGAVGATTALKRKQQKAVAKV
ncbi:PEP-CTERM sorting domain-containing protein [Nostocales cyanobacterium LEGE 11386]|nr:PEP-CTERM sorting domain-containing protein [Nostocales cyanobacterium LEGE 11386]